MINIISNAFSGMSPMEERGEFKHTGMTYYFNLFSYLNKNKIPFNIFFLKNEDNLKQRKIIKKVFVKNLSREIMIIRYFRFFGKNSFIFNKLCQYLILFFIADRKAFYYVDRGNYLFSYILSWIGIKHAIRVLGIHKRLYDHLIGGKRISSKINRSVFYNKSILKIITRDGSYSEMLGDMPNTHLLFNGIDLVRRETIKEPSSIVYISRVHKDKGQNEFVEALYRIKASEFKATIVGDGPYLSELKRKVQEYGIDDKIIFTGAIDHDHIAAILEKAGLFVSINHIGMFGNNLLEAAKMGLPSIILDHPDIKTPLKDNFIIVDRENLTKHLSDKIKKFVDDNNVYKEYSELSEKFSELLYSWEERISLEMSIIDNFRRSSV